MLDNSKRFLHSLPNKPGVYQMLADDGRVLYVGKAKNLKKRVQSYFRSINDPKVKSFMRQVNNVEVIVTANENDAWLLESNLIKLKKPRYNILFKDDKSFPYLVLSKHDFPRLSIYRGAIKKDMGRYFGPYPDRSAVSFIFNLAQKIFRLRVCKDSYMKNRSRPCMLHQIKLCGAPCKGFIDKAKYSLQVELLEKFLNNESDYVVEEFSRLMDEASKSLDYESAANYRDKIADIRKIQLKQVITKEKGSYDIIAVVVKEGRACINILFVRNGSVVGSKNFFPKIYNFMESEEDILLSFIRHYYFKDVIPECFNRESSSVKHVIPECFNRESSSLDKIFFNVKINKSIKLSEIFSSHPRGDKKKLVEMAEENAINALQAHLDSNSYYEEFIRDLKKSLSLSFLPKHIECFDVSHTMGESEVASCVVFKNGSLSKKDYRRFNIKTTQKGDDYQALCEVVFRRLVSLDSLPDLIIIDGGIGQLNVVSKVLKDLDIKDLLLIAIAKGKSRTPGLEDIYLEGKKEPLNLSPKSLAFRFIQLMRDEAHRFAIGHHRKKMRVKRLQSELEKIPGISKKKSTALLKHFGGLSRVQGASIEELSKVKGIGKRLAKCIYDHLHA